MGMVIFIVILQGGINDVRELCKVPSTVPGTEKASDKQKLLLMKCSSLG